MSAADPIEALVALLRADAPLAELVVGRVYGGEIPRAAVAAMPQRCVLLDPAGGGFIGQAFQDYSDIRVDVHCYGETRRDAWHVHLACRDALKQMRSQTIAGVRLLWARSAGGGVLAREPDTEWATAVSSWQVLAGETLVA